MIKIREIDADNEKMCNCISCSETSTSITTESMYEIKTPDTTINICNECFIQLERAMIEFM